MKRVPITSFINENVVWSTVEHDQLESEKVVDKKEYTAQIRWKMRRM